MKKRGMMRLAVVLCLVAVLLVLPLQVAAEDGVPQPVLSAKDGVLRIITVSPYGVYTGTGFAVGTQDRLFVVTNYHVVEDSESIYVYYDTGKYVTASVYYSDPARDLAVLKPDNTIPRVKVLPVETEDIESGIAVYALGFPAAADYFTYSYDTEYATEREFLASVTADKNSMTITNGIVSALHNSTLIGDGTRQVAMLQTNTALNGGNSGGPLLNNAGHVVGVNTMGLTEIADSINGAVSAEELSRVLRDARVRVEDASEASVSVAQESGGASPMTIILILMAVAVVGGGVAAAVVLARQKRTRLKNGMTLEAFEHTYRKVEEMATLEMTLRFVQDLLPLARYDLNPLFTPANVLVGDDALALKHKDAKARPGAQPAIYPGYSAPEVLNGRAGPAATVYFVGGVMYTMITGHRPPDARQRLAENSPAFPGADPIRALVNRAMEPYEQNRIQDLYQLSAAMQKLAEDLRARQGVAF